MNLTTAVPAGAKWSVVVVTPGSIVTLKHNLSHDEADNLVYKINTILAEPTGFIKENNVGPATYTEVH